MASNIISSALNMVQTTTTNASQQQKPQITNAHTCK